MDRESRNTYAREYYRKNRDHLYSKMRERWATNPEAHKKSQWKWGLKRNYGITEEQYFQMLESQGGVCAICKKENKSAKRMYVDHDHVTGQVRGILCITCNTTLGHLEKDGFQQALNDYLSNPPYRF